MERGSCLIRGGEDRKTWWQVQRLGKKERKKKEQKKTGNQQRLVVTGANDKTKIKEA